MTLRIFKYPLETVDYQTIEMPIGAQILTVQVQGGEPKLWALVDDEKEKAGRVIKISGTGHPLGEEMVNLSYIGTYQLLDGAFIGHVFEVIE